MKEFRMRRVLRNPGSGRRWLYDLQRLVGWGPHQLERREHRHSRLEPGPHREDRPAPRARPAVAATAAAAAAAVLGTPMGCGPASSPPATRAALPTPSPTSRRSMAAPRFHRRHLHLRLADRCGGADRDRDERWLAHHAERPCHGDGRPVRRRRDLLHGNAAGDECVDATAHTGVRFDISGSIAGTGCTPSTRRRQRSLGGERD